MLTETPRQRQSGDVTPTSAAALPLPKTRVERPMRVFMMDLLSIVPYYTGHLSLALKEEKDLRLDLGTITYHLDREYFRSQNLKSVRPLVDIVSKFDFNVPVLRRLLKAVEYCVNLSVLLIRFLMARPDLLHVQFLPMLEYGVPVEVWFIRMVRGLGIPVVYTVHNVLPHNTGERLRARYAMIYHAADRLICHDATAKVRLTREFDVPAERISVIPHGPLLQQTSSVTPAQCRRELGLPENGCLVLWQGILQPYKGVPFLLNAWRRIHSLGTGARLAIVGTGSDELITGIREQVAALGIESSVTLDFRFVSAHEVGLIHQAADILVYPYSDITTSGALMTGAGYGKAIVASRLAAFEQILRDEDSALLLEYGNEEELSERLLRLIEDPALCRRLGERVRETSSSGRDWTSIAKLTLACYEAASQRTPTSQTLPERAGS